MAQEQKQDDRVGSSELVYFRYSVGNIYRIHMRPISIESEYLYRAIRVDSATLQSKVKVHFCEGNVREGGRFTY